MQGPGYAGGGGVVAGAEEGHDLVAHGVEAEGGFAGGFEAHVVLDDEGDDVLVLGVGGFVFLPDNVRRLADDDVAGLQDVAVHFGGQVFCHRDEGRQAVQYAGADVEGKHEPVGFADGCIWVLERVEVGAEAGFADDVERGAVEPFKHLDRFGCDAFCEHIALPQLGQEQGFAPEDWREGFDALDGEAGREGFALVLVGVAFCEENAFAEDADHPLLRSVGLGVVVWVFDAHVRQRVVVRNGQAFRAEGEEIADDGAVGLVPFTIRDTDFVGNDCEELAP